VLFFFSVALFSQLRLVFRQRPLSERARFRWFSRFPRLTVLKAAAVRFVFFGLFLLNFAFSR